MSVAVLLFAFTPSFWLGVALAVIASCAISINGIGTQVLTQSAVDNDMRGRVMSLYGVLFRAGPAVGAVVIGVVGDHVGLVWPTAAGALVCGLVWIWSLRHRAAIRAALLPPQE
jgi:predicted MFS family arabinose efflux permease